MNIVDKNIEKLKEMFPEVFSEGKVDFEKLQEELGEFSEDKEERYNFTWNGKSEAKKIALTQSTGTLRPCKKDSKNWDDTQNLYIEGDNLEVLKLLQKSYHKKVKMIYIDPPYNTGKDFVYKDNFHDNVKNYLEITGQVDSDGNKFSTNSETSGRYHSDWLNMIYPRLKLARNLLKDDGVIFISIDDNEVVNLRKICDEIFGEDNFIAQFVWRKKAGGGNDSIDVAVEHEYIISYKKSKHAIYKLPLKQETIKDYKYSDEKVEINGKYKLKDLNDKSLSDSPGLHYDIECPDGTILNGNDHQWKCNYDTFVKRQNDNRIVIKRNTKNEWKVYYKIYLNEEKGELRYDENGDVIQKGRNPESLLYSIGLNKQGNDELKNIFNNLKPFDYPKPTVLIDNFIKMGTKSNDIILDFFSGSATTAHSIMKTNNENNTKRKFIMVQLPEQTNNDDYPTICEIGKERIRRAGDKIVEESGNTDLDIGFKVFKLDSSNIKKWDSDYGNLEQTLDDMVDNIKSGREKEDLLYEIILKYGLDLTLPIEEKTLNDKKVYIVGFGSLVICLEDNIDLTTVEEIAQLKQSFEEDYGLEEMRVVFKDGSFEDSVVKTNALQILKQHDINEVVSV